MTPTMTTAIRAIFAPVVASLSRTALSRRNFPKKPANGGTPARETIDIVSAAARSGDRRCNPAKAGICSPDSVRQTIHITEKAANTVNR